MKVARWATTGAEDGIELGSATPGGTMGPPVGTICMWSALNGSIPADWAECNGVDNAPGPDLTDSFVIGRGTKAVDTTGGSNTLTHAGTAVGAHTEVMNHTHAVNVTDSGHSHITQRYPTATGGSSGFTADTSMSGTPADNTLATKSATTGISATTANPVGGVASITHSVTQPNDHTGVEPPYYALIFIQRMV